MGCSKSKELEVFEPATRCTAEGIVFSEKMEVINEHNRNTVTWLPESQPVKGLLFISHGLNEHSLAYFGIGIAMAQLGYAVHAIDHVGHGLSLTDPGVQHGVIPDWSMLVDDFVAYCNAVRAQHSPELKSFLLAHSMGSLVGILAAPKLTDLTAAVFSGCALVAGPASASPFGCGCLYPVTKMDCIVCLASCTASMDPGGPAAPLKETECNSNTEELTLRARDKRYFHGFVTNKSAFELSKMIRECMAQVPKITMPFLAVHGAEDVVCMPEGTMFLYEHASTDIGYKKLLLYKGVKHEPMHEIAPQGPKAIADVVEYFESFIVNNDNSSTAQHKSGSAAAGRPVVSTNVQDIEVHAATADTALLHESEK